MCLFKPEIVMVVEIPSRCMTYNLSAISWSSQHGFLPEVAVHWLQAQGHEETLCRLHNFQVVVALSEIDLCNKWAALSFIYSYYTQ